VATFIKGSDIPWVVAGFSVHPVPEEWRDWVIAHTTDSDVVDVVNELGQTGVDTIQEQVLEELRRIADTDAEVSLLQTTEDGTGRTVTVQAKGKGFIG